MFLATYQIEVKLLQDATIPPYLGSVLRHEFEKAFRDISLPSSEDQKIPKRLQEASAWSYIFDMDARKDDYLKHVERRKQDLALRAEVEELKKKLAGEDVEISDKDTDPTPQQSNVDIPKPFVIEAPFATQPYDKRKGEVLTFNLILIGDAVAYLPHFLLAFEQAGRAGLANGQIQFDMMRVLAVDALTNQTHEVVNKDKGIWSNQSRILRFGEVENGFKQSQFEKVNKLSVEFITPFRVKRTQKALESPDFFLIAKSTLRRLMSLSKFHARSRVAVDYKELMELTKEIKVVDNQIEWFDWGKYSPKNENNAQIGGLYGKVTYEGPFARFLPYLVFGQLVHVGKNTTYGLGKYVIDFEVDGTGDGLSQG